MIRRFCTSIDGHHLNSLLRSNFVGNDNSNKFISFTIQHEKAKKNKQEIPLQDLLHYSDCIRKNKELFEIGSDVNGRIDCIILQTYVQKSSSVLYDDFSTIDGAHDRKKY